MDEVGTLTAVIAIVALVTAAVTAFLTRRWFVASLLGTLASQLLFLIEFGPTSASEMLFPLAYFAVPAVMGALLGIGVRKVRGTS